MTKHELEQNDKSRPEWPIKLERRQDGAFLVSCVGICDPFVPQPFPMPALALSNALWLNSFANTLWGRRGRCVALWLILDCRSQRWSPPIIPRQSCGRDGAAWRLDPIDFEDLPSLCRPSGSFQSRLARGPEEAASSVPPLDGLHLVQCVGSNDWELYAFLRAEGLTRYVGREDVIVDDWQQAIDAHGDRLEIL
jgi:hypothetical protein